MPGCKRGTHTNAHTPQWPNQEWRSTAETQAEHAHPHRTSQPRRTGYKRGTQTHTLPNTPARSGGARLQPWHQHTLLHRIPARRCRGPGGVRTQTHTHPNTSPRSTRAQLKPEQKHTHPHRTPDPGTVGYRQSAHTTTHARTKNGGKRAETQAQPQTPQTPARKGRAKRQPVPKHSHPGPEP